MKTAEATRFLFDEFEIDAERRVLLKNGQTIPLKPKTFDLLVALVERRGVIVSKNDLLDAVWEDSFVEEKNLTVHIAALRKALGERKNENRFIVTVPGTGYKFVAPPSDSEREIVIETERFERITIEEEEKKSRRAEEKKLGWSFQKTLLFSLSLLLLFSLLGGYFWQKNSRSQNNAATSVKRLTTNGKVQTAALSPDGKLFAYTKKDSGKSSLWLGFTGGGNDLELCPPGEAVYDQLAFSPDGNRLYFSRRDERNPAASLYKISSFGGVAEKIAENVSNFSLSPDGNRMAYGKGSGDGRVLLMIADVSKANEREILSFPQAQTLVFGSISWSPDGGRVAFGCQREMFYQDLCLAETANGKTEKITLPNYRSILKTAWLKSDDGVIVTAIPESNNSSVVNYQILHVELPGGKIRAVTNDLNTYNSDIGVADDSKSLLTVEHRQLNNIWVAPSGNFAQAKQITFGSFGKYDGLWGLDWTPDGRIIYNNSNAETQIISVMNADGSGQKDLTSPGFMDSALTVSNDGRYVVFHSIRGGAPDIWRMDADGGNLKQLTFDQKSFSPSVSPDNRYVYYKSWQNDLGELRRVSIGGGEPEILTDKETGWTTFSPDGKFFAATYRTDQRRLAIFSAGTNELVKQFDLPKTAVIDMRPRWTPDSSAIIYRDGNIGYWSQSIEGGEPTKLQGLPSEELFTHAFSKDGKQFAFVRGQTIRDVILISNFR